MLFISISPATHPWVSSHAWLLSMNSINIMRRKYPWAGRRINIYWIRAPAWETRKWNILMWFNGRKESFRHRSSKGFFTWENSQGLQSFWFCSLWMICDHQEKYLSFSSFSKSIFKYISLFCLNLEKATATPCRGISGIWKVLFVLSSSGHSSPLWEFHTRNTNVNTSTSTSIRNTNASSAITKIENTNKRNTKRKYNMFVLSSSGHRSPLWEFHLHRQTNVYSRHSLTTTQKTQKRHNTKCKSDILKG